MIASGAGYNVTAVVVATATGAIAWATAFVSQATLPSQYQSLPVYGLLVFIIVWLLGRFDKLLSKNTKALELLVVQVARSTVILIQHDATVRGENPETLGSTEDLLRRVLEVRQ